MCKHGGHYLAACALAWAGLVDATPLDPLQGLADPMRPPAVQRATIAGPAAPEPAAGLRLQGIRSDGRGRLAVLNGKAVRVGQEVEGATVTGIGRDSVTVSRDGRSSELKLAGRDVKTVHRRAQ